MNIRTHQFFMRAAAALIVTVTSAMLLSCPNTASASPAGLAGPRWQYLTAASGFACPYNAFCLYEHIQFTQGGIAFWGDVPNLAVYKYNNGHQIDNNSESMINNAFYSVDLFKDTNNRNRVYTAKTKTSDVTFDNNDCWLNVSSIYFY